MKHVCMALGLGVAMWAGLIRAAAATDAYVAYSGTANAPQTNKFLYGESHVLKYRDGRLAERVVVYTCADGSAFARKTVAYVDALAPDFSLEDVSTGLRQGVHSNGSVRTAYFRGATAEIERQSSLPQLPGLVADTGFDEFVRENWAALVSGSSLEMPFLLPSRLEQRTFRVEHVRGDQLGGTAVELFRLRLAGPLGLLVPSIDVYYGTENHVLIRYVGISDLRDASHANFKVQIDFPLQARVPGDEALMNDARRRLLAACNAT